MEIENVTFKGVEELSISELKSTVAKCNVNIRNLEKELDKIVSLRDYLCAVIHIKERND